MPNPSFIGRIDAKLLARKRLLLHRENASAIANALSCRVLLRLTVPGRADQRPKIDPRCVQGETYERGG